MAKPQITRAQFLEYLLFHDDAAKERAAIRVTELREAEGEFVKMVTGDPYLLQEYNQRRADRGKEHAYFKVPGRGDTEEAAAMATFFRIPGDGDNG